MVNTDFKSAKRSQSKFLGLALLLLVCMLMLAACGADTPVTTSDNNFTVPTYAGATEITQLENDPNFVKQVTVNDPSTGGEQVKTYATTDGLDKIKSYYSTQMVSLGWADRSSSIIDPSALGSDADALGFEKAGTNPTANHVVGIFAFTSASTALKPYANDLTQAQGKNIIVVITGSSASGTPGASTSTTPTPTSK